MRPLPALVERLAGLTPTPMLIIGANRQVVAVNAAARACLQVDAARALPAALGELGGCSAALAGPLEQALNGPLPVSFAFDGRQVRVEGFDDLAYTLVTLEAATPESDAPDNPDFHTALLDAIQQGLIATTLDGHVLYWNHAVEALSGIAAHKVIGRHILDVGIATTPRDEVEQILARVGAGDPWISEVDLRRPDGSTYPIALIVSPLYGAEQQVIGALAVFQDVSERKAAEAELLSKHHLLQTVIDTVPENIYVKDLQGRFLLDNAARRRLLGVSAFTLIGKTDLDIHDPQAAAAYIADDRQVLETGQPLIDREEIVVDTQGIARRCLTTKVPLRDADGQIVGLVGVTRDITQRKQAEERLIQERNLLRTLIDFLPDPVYVKDTGGRYLVTNTAHAWTARLQPADLIRRTDFDIFPASIAEAIVRDDMQVLQTGAPILNREDVIRLETGEHVWSLMSDLPWRGNQNELLGVIGIRRDISQWKQSEQAEREQRVLAESLADVTAAMTGTLDLQAVLRRILENVGRVVPHDAANIMLLHGKENVRFASWRGYAPELDEFFRNQRLTTDKPGLHHMYTTGQPDLIISTADIPGWNHLPGDPWVQSCLGVPVIAHDRVIGFLSVDSRVTGFFTQVHAQRLRLFADHAAIAIENAQLYEQIRRHAEELERRIEERTVDLREALQRERELGELKMRFVSMVSHEFRTPLAIIQSSSDLLRYYGDRYTPERRTEQLAEIQVQIQHMTELLEDFLTLSRAEGGGLKFAPVEADPTTFVGNIVNEVARVTATHYLRFTSSSPSLLILIDPRLMRQVVMNLISNAIKYSPEGSTIHADVSNAENWIYIRVRDEGIGIPEHDQRHLFDLFHRGANVGNIPGTGLGLPIVRRAVDAHSGQVSFESQVGQGTTFTVRLPMHIEVAAVHRP